MSDDLRNWILTAEIFHPGMFNLGFHLDHFVLYIEALRSWDDEIIVNELQRMETEGLVERKHGAWSSTFKGQVARERFVQSLGGRAACLRDQHLHELDDLVLAIIVAPQIGGDTRGTENDDTIRVYLHQRADDCKSAGESLAEKGYVRLIDQPLPGTGWASDETRMESV